MCECEGISGSDWLGEVVKAKGERHLLDLVRQKVKVYIMIPCGGLVVRGKGYRFKASGPCKRPLVTGKGEM